VWADPPGQIGVGMCRVIESPRVTLTRWMARRIGFRAGRQRFQTARGTELNMPARGENMALLSPKRRDLLVNSLSDISKEGLMAAPAGIATGKLKLFLLW
jgi:hypothetical protein